MKLVLNETLVYAERSNSISPEPLVEIIKSTNAPIADKVTLYENLIPQGADYYHQNVGFYLEVCWQTHGGVVFRPDMFYFTVFNEIAKYINANVEACRHLFTKSADPTQEKDSIVIVQDVEKCIELDRLAAALKDKVPMGVDGLLPEFTTDSPMAKEARFAAFAEACSPYYRYYTTRCGISKIRLEGDLEDWLKICQALKRWAEVLPSKEIKEYLGKCLEIVEKIAADVEAQKMTVDFWKNMYFQINCGSGSPWVCGWACDLNRLKQEAQPHGFKGHITKVKWTVLETGRKFVAHHGLFYSKMDAEGYLVPHYSRLMFNRPETDGD